MNELHLIWTANGVTLKGQDGAQAWHDELFSHGPLFPGTVTDWKTVFLTSSCAYDKSDYVLSDLAIYVETDKDTLTLIRDLAAREYGIQVSFDKGQTVQCLTDTPVFLPPGSIPANTGSAELRPYDTAQFQVRMCVPADFTKVGKFSFRIAATFEVL